MRNVFDQYEQNENKLTHALMCALAEDDQLCRRFLKWILASKVQIPTCKLQIIEQSLPNQTTSRFKAEIFDSTLPDGCIHDGEKWAVIIESKVQAALKLSQLNGHRRMLLNKDFMHVYVCAIVANKPNIEFPDNCLICLWSDVYQWLNQQGKSSEWAVKLKSYMEILEVKFIREGYLTMGNITMFDGINFGKKDPYNYEDAKRLVRIAMSELKKRSDLIHELNIDVEAQGRGKIKGRESSSVWDFIKLKASRNEKNNTKYPHLTFGIHQDYLHAIVIVPDKIKTDFRRNLLDGGLESFSKVFEEMLNNFNHSFKGMKGVQPIVEIVQRHYLTQSSEPTIDAKLEFDLRSSFANITKQKTFIKFQHQWIKDAFSIFSEKRKSNIQLAVGVRFHYSECEIVNNVKILDCIANAWIMCKPLLTKMGIQNR